MTDKVQLSTFEDALKFLADHDGTGDVPPVAFTGELSVLHVVVDGSRYCGTIPGDLARGLWELQEAIYKAAAYALRGAEDIRKLTSDERRALELVFRVAEGSTDLTAVLGDFLQKLAEGMINMSDRQKTITVVLVAAIVATGYGFAAAVESTAAVKQDQIKADVDIAESRERTRQLEIFGALAAQNAAAQRFAQATEDGARSLMRGASDASELRVGRAQFTSSEINEVNQRAPKVKSEAKVIQEEFSIFGAETRHGSSTRYILGRLSDHAEFAVTVIHDEFQQGDLDRLWAAARDRKSIRLEVNLTTNRGAIRTAQIVQVL